VTVADAIVNDDGAAEREREAIALCAARLTATEQPLNGVYDVRTFN